jgi:hypothetical protein
VHLMDTVLVPGSLSQIPMGSLPAGNGGMNGKFNVGGTSSGAVTRSSTYSLWIVAATMVAATMSVFWAL